MHWDDGQLTEYEWDGLRRACPCAYCSGEGTFAGNVNPDTKFSEAQTTLKKENAVARNGLTPEWADANATATTPSKCLRPPPEPAKERTYPRKPTCRRRPRP